MIVLILVTTLSAIGFLSLILYCMKYRKIKVIQAENKVIEQALEIADSLAEYPVLTESVLYDIGLYRQFKRQQEKIERTLYRI